MLLASLGGCMGERPGELVGRYRIDGELLENTCGSSALPAVSPLHFEVEVRDDEGAGIWYLNPPGQRGLLDESGSFEFVRESRYTVGSGLRDPNETLLEMGPERFADPELGQAYDPANSTRSCQMVVAERIEGRLHRALLAGQDAGLEAPPRDAEASDLTAKNSIEVRAASPGECDFVLEDEGGPFQQLPCAAEYTLSGMLLN
ncbi:MAG: hypothetical protein OEZ06_23695 [Myxococcales bacterium]|nr:hypothetical protein [Myxococcales bacterium]